MIRIWEDDHALEVCFKSSDFFFGIFASPGQEKKSELQGSKPQRIIFSTETLITRIPSAGHRCLGFGIVIKSEPPVPSQGSCK